MLKSLICASFLLLMAPAVLDALKVHTIKEKP